MFAASILRPLVRKHKEKHDRDRAGVLHHVWARMASEVREWRRRSRDRRALAAMSDRSLRDIGLTRYDADWEASKPFWRA
jgi:uncharacterized protein YjiS (DUF1127 family)